MTSITINQAPAPARRNVTGFYIAQSTKLLARNIFFLIFTIAMPLVMYVLFSQLFGQQSFGSTNVSALIMVAMGSYGAFGAALNGGALLQLERRTGWFRQLQLTALSPAGFVAGKVVAAMLAVLPALGIVYLAGATVGGVEVPNPVAYFASIVIVWITMIPMVVMGLAIALWVKLEAVQPVLTISMMVLAIVGGMFFPSQMFPEWLQSLGAFTPTYWIVQLGQWPFVGGSFPWQGVATLAIWLGILGMIAGFGFRRAVKTSNR